MIGELIVLSWMVHRAETELTQPVNRFHVTREFERHALDAGYTLSTDGAIVLTSMYMLTAIPLWVLVVCVFGVIGVLSAGIGFIALAGIALVAAFGAHLVAFYSTRWLLDLAIRQMAG